MRWPSGHLTWPLNPQKKKQKTKENKQKQETKKDKKEKKEKKEKKTKLPKKELFRYQSMFWWVSNMSLFCQLGPLKRAPPKHYKNRGFSKAFFEKEICVTKRPCLDKKLIQKLQLSFFAYFLLLQQQKTYKMGWDPYFYSVFANLKEDNFQILNLKHRKLKNPNFAPVFLENFKIIGHQENTKW